jgi:hypothetical protein
LLRKKTESHFETYKIEIARSRLKSSFRNDDILSILIVNIERLFILGGRLRASRPISILMSLLISTVAMPTAFAATVANPQTYNFDGQLTDASNNVVAEPNIVVTIDLYDSTGTCLLYEEQDTVDTSSTNGHFSIAVGSPQLSTKRTTNDPGLAMPTIFSNSASITGAMACNFTPTANAGRQLKATIVSVNGGTIVNDQLSQLTIAAVPYATVADSIQGLGPASLLQVSTSGSLTQANLQAAFSGTAYTNLQSVMSGNFVSDSTTAGAALPTTTPTSPVAGSVWYNSSANTVYFYNGTTAQPLGLSPTGVTAGQYTKVTVNADGQVTAGTTLVETDLPVIVTPGKVSGSAITSGTIGGTTTISTSGSIASPALSTNAVQINNTGNTFFETLRAPASLATDLSLTLPLTAGTSGQILQTDGAGNLSWASTNYVANTNGTVSGGLTLSTGSMTITTGGLFVDTAAQFQGGIQVGSITGTPALALQSSGTTSSVTIAGGTGSNNSGIGLALTSGGNINMTPGSSNGVGINQPTPTAGYVLDIVGSEHLSGDLDITGNVHATGTITANGSGLTNLASSNLTGTVLVANGGTGSTTGSITGTSSVTYQSAPGAITTIGNNSTGSSSILQSGSGGTSISSTSISTNAIELVAASAGAGIQLSTPTDGLSMTSTGVTIATASGTESIILAGGNVGIGAAPASTNLFDIPVSSTSTTNGLGLDFNAQSSSNSSGTGGTVNIVAGNGTGTGTNGSIFIEAGSGTGVAGSITIGDVVSGPTDTAQTLNMGNLVSGTLNTSVNIGSVSSSATGNSTVSIGTSLSSTGTSTVNLANTSAGASNINIGSTSSGHSTINLASIGTGLSTVTIGNSVAGSLTTIQGGTSDIKIGNTGSGFTAMGVCTVASAATIAISSSVNFTCSSMPATTAVAVSCSPAALTAGAAVMCHGSGTAGQVACTNGGIATQGSTTWTCMWMLP